MGVVQNIFGLVRDINQRRENAKIEGELRNYLTNPDATITAVNQIDPRMGIALNAQRQGEVQATAEREAAARERQMGQFGQFTGMLGTLPEGADLGAAIDGISPAAKQLLGVDDNTLGQWRAAVIANPSLLTAMDPDARKAMLKGRYEPWNISPGGIHGQGDRIIARAPYATRPVTVKRGDGGSDLVPFDPNSPTGGGTGVAPAIPEAPAGGGGNITMSVDALRPHIIAQESSGDYTARNKETGALGAYQIMPETGAALAKRLGLPWRPDMMRHDDPASKRYQDAIGGAAIEEAIGASGGDPRTAFMYYHGGSNRSIWGPKTNTYADEMLGRVGGGAQQQPQPQDGGGGLQPIYRTPGKPASQTDKRVRDLSPDEIAARGLPEGTFAQEDPNGKLVNIRTPPASQRTGGRTQALQIKQATSLVDSFSGLERMANQVLGHPGLDSILGNVYGRMPVGLLGQDAVDVDNLITNLRQNVGLTALNNFKGMSATGASGFGNLSNEEGRRLEAMFGTLERTTSPTVFRNTLRQIISFSREHRQAAEAGIKDAQAQGGGGQQGGARPVGTVIRNPSTGEERTWDGRGWRVTKQGRK